MGAVGNFEIVENNLGTLSPGLYSESVPATSGKVVLGGGIEVTGGTVSTLLSRPNFDGTEWLVDFNFNSGSPSVKVVATCAEMGG